MIKFDIKKPIAPLVEIGDDTVTVKFWITFSGLLVYCNKIQTSVLLLITESIKLEDIALI